MNYTSLAWRNLWRNKRRTIITSSSILFAVFFVVVMRSFQLGTYNHLITNNIESYMGFLQIQHSEYQNDMTIDNSLEYKESFILELDKKEGIKAVVPRVESFALASTGSKTKGVAILGVDPQREMNMSNPARLLIRHRITSRGIEQIKQQKVPQELTDRFKPLINNSYSSLSLMRADLKISEKEFHNYEDLFRSAFAFEGDILNPGDDGALVSDRLARFLNISVGDTLVLFGQGFRGSSAAGLFPVRGIIKIPSPDLDNKVVYISLKKAQDFFGLYDRLTSISINLYDNSDQGLERAKLIISESIGPEMSVRDWKEFNKVLFQQIQSDDKSGQLILGLLYFIVFFGIFGTVLMMVYERKREFGILISIGMKRWKLALVTILEMLFMGLIGVVAGITLSIPLLYIGSEYPYRMTGDMAQIMESFGYEPIMPLLWVDAYVFWQGFIVACMVVLSCLYPLKSVFQLKEIEAVKA
jgi:ABC-type lipoprotein release transport system permease subunit